MILAPTRLSETPVTQPSENLSSLEPFAGRKRWTRSDCDFLERLGMLPRREVRPLLENEKIATESAPDREVLVADLLPHAIVTAE